MAESIVLDELLAELRRERQHVALVADEHGTTILVTLEDVIEELVGEIEDEFDTGATPLIRHEAGTVVAAGGAAAERGRGSARRRVHRAGSSYHRGHVLELLGRLPEPGETVVIDGYRAEVLRADDTRITALRFTQAPHK